MLGDVNWDAEMSEMQFFSNLNNRTINCLPNIGQTCHVAMTKRARGKRMEADWRKEWGQTRA